MTSGCCDGAAAKKRRLAVLAFLRFALLVVLGWSAIAPPNATIAQIYSEADLKPDAVRLRNAAIKIYELGLKPSLTAEEKKAIGDFSFNFPMPRKGDELLNFAATTDGRFLIMPVMSLRALEDMATAYAWLYHNKMSLSTIDLYYAMLRYRGADVFPGGQLPKILDALGIPADAYKTSKAVDELSLRLRNDAFAFVIAHELGHIRYRHKPVSAISAQQARADESESDRFALDLLGRTGTAPLGAALFFQAQIYSLLHRHEFRSDDDWQKYVTLRMTHPLSVDRIKSMADYIEGPFLRARPTEIGLWLDIAARLRQMTGIMEDLDLARCVVMVAREADPAILKPRRGVESEEMLKRCR